MKTFLNQSTLGRRVGVCPETLAKKLRDGVIEPDGVVVTGGKLSLLFDTDRLPDIRKSLLQKFEPSVIV